MVITKIISLCSINPKLFAIKNNCLEISHLLSERDLESTIAKLNISRTGTNTIVVPNEDNKDIVASLISQTIK